jgi:hypothetical protein
MTDVGNNGIFEPAEISRALDLDGAVTQPEDDPEPDDDSEPVGAPEPEPNLPE